MHLPDLSAKKTGPHRKGKKAVTAMKRRDRVQVKIKERKKGKREREREREKEREASNFRVSVKQACFIL